MITSFGKAPEGEVTLDLEILLTSKMGLLAGSGQGKSWALRRLAETALKARAQVIFIDPEGEFASLREVFPDIALVGKGGEMPADVKTAGLIARTLVKERMSAVIDLYELKPKQREIWAKLFFEEMMGISREDYSPLLLIVDEAQMFAPDPGFSSSETTDALLDVAARGRKRGYGLVLATQRIAQIHKGAWAQLKTQVLGGFFLDTDVKRAADMLGFLKADYPLLKQLEPGEFYGYGPAFNHRGIRRFKTGDVRSTHPKPGKHKMVVPPASKSLLAIIEKIGSLPAIAQQEADQLTLLRGQVADLTAKLSQRPAPAQPLVQTLPPEIRERVIEKMVEMPVVDDVFVATIGGTATELRKMGENMIRTGEGLMESVERVQRIAAEQKLKSHDVRKPYEVIIASAKNSVALVTPAQGYREVQQDGKSRTVITKPAEAVIIKNVGPAPEADDAPLGKAETLILTALAQEYPKPLSMQQIAILTVYSYDGGGFVRAVGRCRSQGWLAGEGQKIEITQQGLDKLGQYTPILKGKPLVDAWIASNHLDKPARACLEILANVYSSWVQRNDLADSAGFEASGGGFARGLGRLRSRGLIEGEGQYKASDYLFL